MMAVSLPGSGADSVTTAVPASLRPLRWQDIPALEALERQLFPQDGWTAAVWWAELAGRPRRRYAVAECAGQIVGYAGVTLGGATADVMTCGVAPPAQGRGVGSQLVRWLLEEAQAGGAAYVMLEVRADNLPARSLYERHGFTQLGLRRRYYQPGDVDAIVMRRATAAT